MGPNISEKFVPGGTNFRGVQIKRDRPLVARARAPVCPSLATPLHANMHFSRNALTTLSVRK